MSKYCLTCRSQLPTENRSGYCDLICFTNAEPRPFTIVGNTLPPPVIRPHRADQNTFIEAYLKSKTQGANMANDIKADQVKLIETQSSIRLDRAIRAFKRVLDLEASKVRADANLNVQVKYLTPEEMATYVSRTERMAAAAGRS